MMMIHGAGLVDEYPTVAYAADYADWGYDGVFEENMVVCVESYIGGKRHEARRIHPSTRSVPMSRNR